MSLHDREPAKVDLASLAFANLGITAGTQQHGDVLSGLVKAVSHRLQIETKKQKFPCSLTQKAGTSDRE